MRKIEKYTIFNLIFLSTIFLFSSISNTQVTRPKMKTNPPYDFTSIDFTTEETGYVVTPGDYENGGLILSTSNSGESWDVIYKPDIKIWFRSIKFIDENIGYVVGSDGNNDGILMETTDSGANWKIVHKITPDRSVVYNVVDVFKIDFVDMLTGYFLEYIDNGSHYGASYYIWKVKRTNTAYSSSHFIGERVFDFTFVDSLLGFGTKIIFPSPGSTGWGKIVKTTNGGREWEQSHFQPGNPLFYSIQTLNEDTVYYVGSKGALFVTTDGGNTWDVKSTFVSNDLFDIKIFKSGIGYIVGSSGTIIKTMDFGETWEIQDSETNENLRSVFFFDENSGIAVGDNANILRTTNGGKKWHKSIVPDEVLTGVKNRLTPPSGFSLNQNYPNPFNNETVISFNIPKSDIVTISIYDLNGKEIEKLINRRLEPGKHTIKFNSKNLPSGLYFYRLKTKTFSQTNKCIVIK